jgi:uncharacterized protein YdaU (DUF1376 family)
MKWYKRDCDAAMMGMAKLSLADRGAYNSLIDLLYSLDGNVPDDDLWVAKTLNIQWLQWKHAKARLIAAGKLWITQGKTGAQLMCKRVEKTMEEAASHRASPRAVNASPLASPLASPRANPEKPNDFNKNSRQMLDTTYKREEEGGYAANSTRSKTEKKKNQGGAPSTWSDEFPWRRPTTARRNGGLPSDQAAMWEQLATTAQPNPDRAQYLQQFRKTILHAKPQPPQDPPAETVAAENGDQPS